MSPLERHLSQEQKHLQRDLRQPANLNQGFSISDSLRNSPLPLLLDLGDMWISLHWYVGFQSLLNQQRCKTNVIPGPPGNKVKKKDLEDAKGKAEHLLHLRHTNSALFPLKLRPHHVQGNTSRHTALPSLAQLPCTSLPFYWFGRLRTPGPQHRYEGLTCNTGWGDFWQDTLLRLQREH